MAQHSRYWSCSKFADWLRGNAKPPAATSEGWSDWRKLASSTHPLRYWLAEEGLDLIQDTVTWPIRKLYDIKYYINNRWVTRTHALTAHPRDIPRGEWRDVGNRFLPCLFNELVDYVEVELAWWHIAWDREARAKYNAPFWAAGWFRWRTWRCPQAGIDNLEWQSSLRWTAEEVGEDDSRIGEWTPQAKNAQEIMYLYRWWTEVYRHRPDPMDASGWSAWCDRNREEGDSLSLFRRNESEADRAEKHRILDLCNKIEADYENEDTEMLLRLIKIRGALWT